MDRQNDDTAAETGLKTGGGTLVVDSLLSEGTDTVFMVPGESFLPVLDALHDHQDTIRTISTRHEEGAGFAAEAWAMATGRPGVAMVTRGPGITNISIALHTAMQNSTPLVVFVGQVPVDQKYREAFQEVDLVSYLSPVVKWAVEIPQTERIPELVREAFRRAVGGRPGPVVVGLPEDVLFGSGQADILPPVRQLAPGVSEDAVLQAAMLLAGAERPLVLVGREVAGAGGQAAVRKLAERWQLPVMTAFRRFDAFPNDHPNYAGPVALGAPPEVLAPLTEADTVLVLGERLDEITTGGYGFMRDATVIHVMKDATSLGTWGHTILAITADPKAFAESLAEREVSVRHDDRTAGFHAGYLSQGEPEQPFLEGGVNISAALETIRKESPADTALITDAGNFAAWVPRFYRFREPHTHFAPLSGAMGYAAPAAVGVALARRGRRVVALAGDGGFAMTMNELSTMKAHNLPITMIVFVNDIHGTIRMHQEKHYPGRPLATDLTNPGFADLARSFGLSAWTVSNNAEFDGAFREAVAADSPTLIEVIEGKERLSVWGRP